jgi:anion-transporting  ArsA/GET3 family ATPase
MNEGLASLLRRRLLIVSGKGGTGKSSITAALALLAQKAGTRAVVVELSEEVVLPRLLCEVPPPGAGEPAEQPRELLPELYHLRVVPELALEEYLTTQLKVRGLVRALTRNSGFRRLLDFAPGWRDLIGLGKLWHLSRRVDALGNVWPLLIVDAPATGHGLSLLSTPETAMEAIRSGPLKRHTDEVHALLTDPARTLVLPVALAEELPTNEVRELRQRVHQLGIALTPTIANALDLSHDDELERAASSLVKAAADAPAPVPLAEPTSLETIARERAARARLQAGFVGRMERDAGVAPLQLPFLFESVAGPSGVASLAAELARALERYGEFG